MPPRPKLTRQILQVLKDAVPFGATIHDILFAMGYPGIRSSQYPYHTVSSLLGRLTREGLIVWKDGRRHFLADLPPRKKNKLQVNSRKAQVLAMLREAPFGLTFAAIARELSPGIETRRARWSLTVQLSQMVSAGDLIKHHQLYGMPGTSFKGVPTYIPSSRWPTRILYSILDGPSGGLTKRQVCIRAGAPEAIQDCTSPAYRQVSVQLYDLKNRGYITLAKGRYRLSKKGTTWALLSKKLA